MICPTELINAVKAWQFGKRARLAGGCTRGRLVPVRGAGVRVARRRAARGARGGFFARREPAHPRAVAAAAPWLGAWAATLLDAHRSDPGACGVIGEGADVVDVRSQNDPTADGR